MSGAAGRSIIHLFRSLITATSVLVLSGCAVHYQSAIDPAGPQAGKIATLWWLFVALLSAIFLIVMGLTLWTLMRPNRGLAREPIEHSHRPSEATERRLRRNVGAAIVATVLIIFALILLSVGTGKAITGVSNKRNGITVEVTGNQWWWQIRYLNDDASRIVVTANEMHIPVGRPVQIQGLSNDVIHSFWVPNLQGKRDLIPSHMLTEWVDVNQPGVYRGQCAEFCGLQHAHMALWVVAEPEDKFEQWVEQQLKPAISPTDALKQRGQDVFLSSACVFCHQIRGTTAAGQTAPDLTHFGSRRGIAANTISNNRGNLAGWIVDAQRIKPGNHMATLPVNPEDVQPLIEYLESLK